MKSTKLEKPYSPTNFNFVTMVVYEFGSTASLNEETPSLTVSKTLLRVV